MTVKGMPLSLRYLMHQITIDEKIEINQSIGVRVQYFINWTKQEQQTNISAASYIIKNYRINVKAIL